MLFSSENMGTEVGWWGADAGPGTFLGGGWDRKWSEEVGRSSKRGGAVGGAG